MMLNSNDDDGCTLKKRSKEGQSGTFRTCCILPQSRNEQLLFNQLIAWTVQELRFVKECDTQLSPVTSQVFLELLLKSLSLIACQHVLMFSFDTTTDSRRFSRFTAALSSISPQLLRKRRRCRSGRPAGLGFHPGRSRRCCGRRRHSDRHSYGDRGSDSGKAEPGAELRPGKNRSQNASCPVIGESVSTNCCWKNISKHKFAACLRGLSRFGAPWCVEGPCYFGDGWSRGQTWGQSLAAFSGCFLRRLQSNIRF